MTGAAFKWTSFSNFAVSIDPFWLLMYPDLLYSAGRFFPVSVRNAVKKAYYKSKWYDCEKNAAILNGIAKSGQNYFMVFIANYLAVTYLDRDEPVSHKMSEKIIIPNRRDNYLQGEPYHDPNKVFLNTPVTDFVYGSSTRFLNYCDGRIVFLFRNPLDFLVSYYFYKFDFRKSKHGLYTSPVEIIDLGLDYYLPHYTEMMNLLGRGNILFLSYESLRISPEKSFREALEWYGFEVNATSLARAIEFSDFKVMRKEEERDGVLHYHDKDNFTGLFTRKGIVGDWKNFFTDEDVKKVDRRLQQHGLSLSDFTLEAS